MSTATIDVRPLKQGFGVEVLGVDLASSGPDTYDRLVELFNRNGIMVVRDQRLSPQAQLAFTRRFGVLETNQRLQYTYPGIPEIYVISNKLEGDRKIGDYQAGQGWHTDASYLETPVRCTMLYAMEVPEEGSDTLLADLCSAYNALPSERREMVDGLQVRHSWRALMEFKGIATSDDDETLPPDVVHPMIRTHPADGRKALWVSTGTVRGVVGMDNPQGLDLIEELVDFATQERFVYRHKWRVGDLLIWDNRCTLHTGTPFDISKYTRHVHRTWVKGERPT